jgi:hypothetical protein
MWYSLGQQAKTKTKAPIHRVFVVTHRRYHSGERQTGSAVITLHGATACLDAAQRGGERSGVRVHLHLLFTTDVGCRLCASLKVVR